MKTKIIRFWGAVVVLAALVLGFGQASTQTRCLSGKIAYEGKVSGPVVLRLYALSVSSRGGVQPLSKGDIYGDADPVRVLTLKKPGSYAFEGLPPGHYAVVGFVDSDRNGDVGFDPHEPFGWVVDEPGGVAGSIDLRKDDAKGAGVILRTPTPFPKKGGRAQHGALRWIHGLPVLQLWGTARERGYAHGFLVGRQIIDFFEFYIVEDNWRSARRYEEIFVPFLENHLACPNAFIEECDAVIAGMRDSGIDMHVPTLNRDFRRTDLLAINAYIEKRSAFPMAESSSCTQFAFWGDASRESDLEGGLIAARNMDGECDVRKVTVSHFLIFAVDLSEPDRKRWVSTMWPGFVGTISGINEEGLYCMENAGGAGPGPVPEGVVPCGVTQRYLLETEGRDATPESVLEAMKPFTCSTGGITAAGSIILWAVPYKGQEVPAFVYEGGRGGYAIRTPGKVRPTDPSVIMAANHHLKYGYDPERPNHSLGEPVSFSSRWRYEVGMHMLEAWSRGRVPMGLDHAVRLLQTVAHGTTEYSVIFLANQMRILVAVDDLKTDMWDAPYLHWAEYEFEELFAKNE
jgi:hypothetical protein